MNLPTVEKITFTKHLSVMIRAGIPLSESLSNLASHAKSKTSIELFSKLKNQVDNGNSFESALNQFPTIFDEFYKGIVRIGENTGRLDESLKYLSEQLNKEYHLQKQVRGAMAYPTLVFVATMFLGGFVSVFVLPKLVDFFTAFEGKLPTTTVILLNFATFMKSYGILLFLALTVLIIISVLIVQVPSVKPYWHRLILRLPLFGRLLQETELARFGRNMGLLVKGGTPIYEALSIAAKSQPNLAYRTELTMLSEQLAGGNNVSHVIKDSKSGLFPSMVTDMIAVGEKTGKFDESLLYVSEFYEDDVNEITHDLAGMLEPVLLIVIGLIVGFMALAIISPIYQITGSLGS